MAQYTEEFKKRVLEAYPNDSWVRGALDSGNAMLGRMLDDCSPRGIDVGEIISLLEAGKADELLAKAKQAQARMKLYSDFWDQPGVRG